jgi:hypothetical protein
MAAAHDDQLPGTWYGPLSLQPARELFDFILKCDDYTKTMRKRAGAAVFKAHPGIRSVLVTDMAGMEHVFHAPPDELDRLATPGFGGLALSYRELLGGVVPALVSHGPDPRPPRVLIDEVLTLRRHAFAPACRRTHDYGLPRLASAKPGEGVDLKLALSHAAISTVFDWLFDLRPGPDAEEAMAFLKGLFGFASDQPLAHRLASTVYRLKNGPWPRSRRYAQATMERIRGCPPYPAFRDAAVRAGVPEAELPAHLLFVASMNAAAGLWGTLYPSLATAFTDRTIRDRLVDELAGFDGDVVALDRLPFLHDFWLESLRLFGRPRHYYRRALRDLDLPTSDGPSVRVPAGSQLCVVATVCRQDRTVFGDDAGVFDPDRYARDPALRERVYPLGPPPGASNAFGCAAARERWASGIWKSVAAPLLRTRDWDLVPWPEPDVDAFDGVVPADLTWRRR